MLQQEMREFMVKGQPFSLEEASLALKLSPKKASDYLFRMIKQGHVLRLRRGIYFPVSNKGLLPEEALADPWIVTPFLFKDGYIGGLSMLHFWGLTDQLFNTTVIFKREKIVQKTCVVSRFTYILFKDRLKMDLGIETLWRETVKVRVSSVHRTMVDVLITPEAGGGIQHVIDCFKIYMKEHYDENHFMPLILSIENSVFFKRLGFLIEKILGENHPLISLCKNRLKNGCSKIDTALPCPTLVTKWNLYIEKGLAF